MDMFAKIQSHNTISQLTDEAREKHWPVSINPKTPGRMNPSTKTITDFKLSSTQVDGSDQEKAHIYRPADLL